MFIVFCLLAFAMPTCRPIYPYQESWITCWRRNLKTHMCLPNELCSAVLAVYIHRPCSLTIWTIHPCYAKAARSEATLTLTPHPVVEQLSAIPATGITRCRDSSAAGAVAGTAGHIANAGGAANGTRGHSFVIKLDRYSAKLDQG